jgi:hypothetical protein
MEVMARILVAPDQVDVPGTWALLFFYINGVRVAPPGFNHMKLKLACDSKGLARWVAGGWELDQYDEWSDWDQLDAECLADTADTVE